MNIKVDTVISDILGKSGKAIIEAILNGNHDPKSLVQLVDPRCKASKETIEKSLEGTWDVVHLFELKQSYDLYKYIHIQIADCEAEMDRLLGEYTDGCGTDMQGYTATKKRVAKKNAISFDAEKHAFSMWGVNAMEIPGMSLGALAVLMGELGSGFTEKFTSAKSFRTTKSQVANFSRARCPSRRTESDRCSGYVPTQLKVSRRDSAYISGGRSPKVVICKLL